MPGILLLEKFDHKRRQYSLDNYKRALFTIIGGRDLVCYLWFYCALNAILLYNPLATAVQLIKLFITSLSQSLPKAFMAYQFETATSPF